MGMMTVESADTTLLTTEMSTNVDTTTDVTTYIANGVTTYRDTTLHETTQMTSQVADTTIQDKTLSYKGNIQILSNRRVIAELSPWVYSDK